jgi:hypothetical protein
MSNLTAALALFPDDALEAVSNSVYRYGWQTSGGVMPFADALGVFRNLLEELRSSDKEDLLDSMPVALQQKIEEHLTHINITFSYIKQGNNQVQRFTDEVDVLHLAVWQGGFRYRAKKIPGYEAKYRQATELAKEIERVKEREATAEQLVSEITSMRDVMLTAQTEFATVKSEVEKQAQNVAQVHARAQTADTNLQTQLASIDGKLTEAIESASEAEAKAQSASTNEKRLQDFIGRVDANEKKLADALTEANQGLASHKIELSEFMAKSSEQVEAFKNSKTVELDEFQERLEYIEQDIVEKLNKATGITLFHAFEKRQEQIKGHWIWLAIAAGALGLVIWLTSAFVNGNTNPNAAFYIKLTLGLPAVVFAGFALQQYGRERRLKEEYAFKSSISLSLVAYQELVEQAVVTLGPDDKAKFADFLVKSIGVIFDSPTERVFGTRSVGGPTDTKIIANLLQTFKEAKSIFDGK